MTAQLEQLHTSPNASLHFTANAQYKVLQWFLMVNNDKQILMVLEFNFLTIALPFSIIMYKCYRSIGINPVISVTLQYLFKTIVACNILGLGNTTLNQNHD